MAWEKSVVKGTFVTTLVMKRESGLVFVSLQHIVHGINEVNTVANVGVFVVIWLSGYKYTILFV